MMRQMTRKRLYKTLKDLAFLSAGWPVRAFMLNELDSEGYYKLLPWEVDEFTLEGVISKLMDLSLTHRIAKIRRQEYVDVRGMCVCFDMIESEDGTTNIDSDMMELVLKLNYRESRE